MVDAPRSADSAVQAVGVVGMEDVAMTENGKTSFLWILAWAVFIASALIVLGNFLQHPTAP